MKKLIEKKSEADFDNLEEQFEEGKEPKCKICIRCNSPFPAHLKGKVCGCVVEWLVEEQFKNVTDKPEEKKIKSTALFDMQSLAHNSYHHSSSEKESLVMFLNPKIKSGGQFPLFRKGEWPIK